MLVSMIVSCGIFANIAALIAFLQQANSENAGGATQTDLTNADSLWAQIRAKIEAAIQAGGN